MQATTILQSSQSVHPQAAHAIKAAKGNWGHDATMRYLRKHGVPFALYRIARQLHIATRAGF